MGVTPYRTAWVAWTLEVGGADMHRQEDGALSCCSARYCNSSVRRIRLHAAAACFAPVHLGLQERPHTVDLPEPRPSSSHPSSPSPPPHPQVVALLVCLACLLVAKPFVQWRAAIVAMLAIPTAVLIPIADL